MRHQRAYEFVDKQKRIGLKNLTNAKAQWAEIITGLTGEFIDEDKGQDTDEWALKVKVIFLLVPTQFDLTAHHAIQELNSWGFEN